MASNTTTPELPPGSFDSRVPTVIGVVTFTLSVATLFVGLRIYTRAVVIKQLGYDDLCAVIALVGGRRGNTWRGGLDLWLIGKSVADCIWLWFCHCVQ